MKCVAFADADGSKTIEKYNQWATGKALHKDVIIHTHVIPPSDKFSGCNIIVIFFDEAMHPEW